MISSSPAASACTDNTDDGDDDDGDDDEEGDSDDNDDDDDDDDHHRDNDNDNEDNNDDDDDDSYEDEMKHDLKNDICLWRNTCSRKVSAYINMASGGADTLRFSLLDLLLKAVFGVVLLCHIRHRGTER